jgi:hypothetical protein
MPKDKVRKKKSQTGAPEDFPRMNDAKRVEPREAHVDNVGQRRPDAESGDELIVGHPDDRENERINEGDADGEGYEWKRSGAV